MKKVKQPTFKFKPYTPKPHPMQHRIDEFRSIPSLWCGKAYDLQKGTLMAVQS